MLVEGRDELTCDMAETYRIYDMKAFPVSYIATLAAGLRENSRIRMKLSGQKVGLTDSLLAVFFDRFNMYYWSQTKDAKHKKNRPKSVYAALTGNDKKQEEVTGFATPEDFEKRRMELMGGGHG